MVVRFFYPVNPKPVFETSYGIGYLLVTLADRPSDSLVPCSAGMTIHSWGAVTPGQTNLDKQIKCIRTCKPALSRWKTTKVLVIDEGECCDCKSRLTTERTKMQFPWWTATCSTLCHPSPKVCGRRPSGHLAACRYVIIASVLAAMDLICTFHAAGHHRRFFPTTSRYKRWRGTVFCLRERRVEEMRGAYNHSHSRVPTERPQFVAC